MGALATLTAQLVVSRMDWRLLLHVTTTTIVQIVIHSLPSHAEESMDTRWEDVTAHSYSVPIWVCVIKSSRATDYNIPADMSQH